MLKQQRNDFPTHWCERLDLGGRGDMVKLRNMDVATEAQTARSGLKASPGFRGAENITPSVRCPGIRMDIEALVLFDAKRQAGQEFPLRPIKPRARPRK